MKYKVLIVIFVILGIISFIFYNFDNSKKDISKILNIDLTNCKVEISKDSHGGFLGDGDHYEKIKCTNKEDKIIKSNWKKLPLESEIEKVMHMKSCSDKGCKDAYEKFNIPNIKNGYYYFLDRHSETKYINDSSELNLRSSYNFSLGIYDLDKNILYYYELDT